MREPNQIQNLLIVVAMEVEEKALLAETPFKSISVSARLGIDIKEFQAGGCAVRVATSGVGPVNAALTLATASERFPLDALLLLGIGGALSPTLSPGDLVVASRVIQHDSILSKDTGSELMAAGDLYLSKNAEDRLSPRLETDPTLRQWIVSSNPGNQVHVGAVLSGSEFVSSHRRKLEIARLDPDSLLVDMEAAAIAQMARRLQIPFAVAKTVADRLNPSDSIEEDYKRSLAAASNHAGNVLKLLLKTFLP